MGKLKASGSKETKARVNGGACVAGRSNVVDAVAIRAHRNFGITTRKAFAMHAAVVLVQLIGTQAGIELAHVLRMRMATSAQLRDLFAINVAFPSRFAAHCLV